MSTKQLIKTFELETFTLAQRFQRVFAVRIQE